MLVTLKALATTLFLSTFAFGATVKISKNLQKRAQLDGLAFSFYRGKIDWKDFVNQGLSFAYVAATIGNNLNNTDFPPQSTDTLGLLRGAYHISIFKRSSGEQQAKYFVSNGGNWIRDGLTLPGAVKVGYDTDDDDCYGLNSTFIVNWIRDFSETYKSAVGRYPAIHTTTHWWNMCTNNSVEFGSTNPLWIIRSGSVLGALPAGWNDYTFWQYENSSPHTDNKEHFNGDGDSLKRLAENSTTSM